MTLINHLPPFFRSLNARVKYFFFLLSPTLIVFISINCDFPRPTISRRRVDGYIFYYFPTKLDVFFPPRKKLSDPFRIALFTTRSRFYCRLFRNLRENPPLKRSEYTPWFEIYKTFCPFSKYSFSQNESFREKQIEIRRIYRSSNVDKHRIKLERRGEELGRNPIIREDGRPLNKNHRLERLLNLFSLDLSPLVGRLFLPPERARGAHSSGTARRGTFGQPRRAGRHKRARLRNYADVIRDLERFEDTSPLRHSLSIARLTWFSLILESLAHFGYSCSRTKLRSEMKTTLKRLEDGRKWTRSYTDLNPIVVTPFLFQTSTHSKIFVRLLCRNKLFNFPSFLELLRDRQVRMNATFLLYKQLAYPMKAMSGGGIRCVSNDYSRKIDFLRFCPSPGYGCIGHEEVKRKI